MARLRALRKFELDKFDGWVRGLVAKSLRIELALRRATTEVAGTDLPDEVAAGVEVVGRDPAFAGVVGESALFGTGVQREHGILRQRTKAHG